MVSQSVTSVLCAWERNHADSKYVDHLNEHVSVSFSLLRTNFDREKYVGYAFEMKKSPFK